MWNRIKNAISSMAKFFNGKKRRIANLGGAATSIGALTGFVPLIIAGTVILAVFGTADQVGKQLKKNKKQ